jgi:hypothetical protein
VTTASIDIPSSSQVGVLPQQESTDSRSSSHTGVLPQHDIIEGYSIYCITAASRLDIIDSRYYTGQQ